MKLVIDVSYYNNLSQEQWDLLASVLDGVIIRLSFGITEDVAASDHIFQARRVGLPFAGYHWADPTRSIDQNRATVNRVSEKFHPAGIYLDAEQYWRDWPAYMRQDLAAAYATRFSPAELDKFYKGLYLAVKNTESIFVGNYSADWFISRYAPDMNKWVTAENYWEARYFRYYDAAWWTAKQKELGRDFDVSHMKEIAAYARIFKGIGRQFESYVEVKGLYDNIRYHLDWNVFTDDGFSRMFGVAVDQQPIQEPEPEPEPLFKTYTVRTIAFVRDAPNGRIVDYRLKGASVVALDVVSGWVRIEGGWMGLSVLVETGNNQFYFSYRVKSPFLWKRETPSGIKIGWLKRGDVVKILEVDNGWGLIEGGGWVGMSYLEVVK